MSTPYKNSNGSWIGFRLITVKSNIDLQVLCYGKEFFLSKASAQLFLRLNDTDERIPVDVGFHFRLPDNDMFTVLTFSQSSGVDITGEFYFGTAEMDFTGHP